MKKLIIAGLLLSGCGTQPAWNGNHEDCDHIVRGACVQGLSAEEVEENLERSEKLFGRMDISGYKISSQNQPVKCGPIINDANGCCDNVNMTIVVQTNSVYCTDYLLVHEFGHIAIDDPHHNDPRWGVLVNAGRSNGKCWTLPEED
jgi:hypothetical protein